VISFFTDLVIADMTMPNVTGEKLAAGFMKIRTDIPIILCTGFSEQISEEHAKEMGIREFILKPISMKKPAGTVRAELDGGNFSIKPRFPVVDAVRLYRIGK